MSSLFSPVIEAPERFGHAEITLRPKSRLLTKPSGLLASFDFSVNPYIGCGFGCSYCYATNFVADDAKREAWGQWIDVKTSAVEELESSNKWLGKRLYMSSVTDPYQPIEGRVCLTQKLLEVMVSVVPQPRLVVQTRGPLVTRDIDLLRQLKHVRVNLSITTDSDEVRKVFEPSCASIERRLHAAEELKAAGIAIGICVSPMLPIENPSAFGRRLAAIDPDMVVTSTFHHSDRQFAANTRGLALPLLAQYRWGREEYERASAAIKAELPRQFSRPGFGPA